MIWQTIGWEDKEIFINACFQVPCPQISMAYWLIQVEAWGI